MLQLGARRELLDLLLVLDGLLLGEALIPVVLFAHLHEALEADEAVGGVAADPLVDLGAAVADGLLVHQSVGGAVQLAQRPVRFLEHRRGPGDEVLGLLESVDVRKEGQ